MKRFSPFCHSVDQSIMEARFGMGRLEKALHYSNESLSENHNYAEARFLKGQALRQLEKYEEAIEEFDKVLSKESKNRDALY